MHLPGKAGGEFASVWAFLSPKGPHNLEKQSGQEKLREQVGHSWHTEGRPQIFFFFSSRGMNRLYAIYIACGAAPSVEVARPESGITSGKHRL